MCEVKVLEVLQYNGEAKRHLNHIGLPCSKTTQTNRSDIFEKKNGICLNMTDVSWSF